MSNARSNHEWPHSLYVASKTFDFSGTSSFLQSRICNRVFRFRRLEAWPLLGGILNLYRQCQCVNADSARDVLSRLRCLADRMRQQRG